MKVSPFKARSYCDVTWRARELAMHGCTAEEISEALGMHMMACQRVVNEAKAHKEAFKNAVAQ